MGVRPLALVCGLQPEAASEPLRRWDEHRGCRGVGSSPGSLWNSPWLALLLLLCLCLAPAWLWFKLPSSNPVTVRSSVSGMVSLTPPRVSFMLWKTRWKKVSPQKP